jgi:hypothetical protein
MSDEHQVQPEDVTEEELTRLEGEELPERAEMTFFRPPGVTWVGLPVEPPDVM